MTVKKRLLDRARKLSGRQRRVVALLARGLKKHFYPRQDQVILAQRQLWGRKVIG